MRRNSECANPHITEVPPEFDLISVDTYAGYKPGSNGMDEVVAAKKIFDVIFPKLHSHQQVLVVPGTFGCGNLSYFPLDQQAKNVVEKLDGYWSWLQQEERIAGMLPWHFNTRPGPEHPPPCDMNLGAATMTTVVAKLEEIGRRIIGNASLPPRMRMNTDEQVLSTNAPSSTAGVITADQGGPTAVGATVFSSVDGQLASATARNMANVYVTPKQMLATPRRDRGQPPLKLDDFIIPPESAWKRPAVGQRMDWSAVYVGSASADSVLQQSLDSGWLEYELQLLQVPSIMLLLVTAIVCGGHAFWPRLQPLRAVRECLKGQHTVYTATLMAAVAPWFRNCFSWFLTVLNSPEPFQKLRFYYELQYEICLADAPFTTGLVGDPSHGPAALGLKAPWAGCWRFDRYVAEHCEAPEEPKTWTDTILLGAGIT